MVSKKLPKAPDFHHELALWGQGVRLIAGVDEAGRGALAGPVAAATLIFPPAPMLSQVLMGVRDSKKMTPRAREFWASRLPDYAVSWGVGFAASEEIDALGIVPATRLAIKRALSRLNSMPEHLLVDYLDLPGVDVPQTAIVKGDAVSLTIAAASILAKTARDKLMCELDRQYPGYGFAAHKGYATAYHLEALTNLGPSPVHRRSFQPVRNLLPGDGVPAAE